MNMLNQLNNLFNPNVNSVAIIKGNRGNNLWVCETMGGGTILLVSNEQFSTNDKVYYNALTSKIVGPAPNVNFSLFAV